MEMSKNTKKIENPKKMATPSELFSRILDAQEELKEKISAIQIEQAELRQAFNDYCDTHDKLDSQQKDSRADWKWFAGLAASIMLAAIGIAINVWPKGA